MFFQQDPTPSESLLLNLQETMLKLFLPLEAFDLAFQPPMQTQNSANISCGNLGSSSFQFVLHLCSITKKALLISLIFGRGPFPRPFSIFSLYQELTNTSGAKNSWRPSAYLRTVLLLWNINSPSHCPFHSSLIPLQMLFTWLFKLLQWKCWSVKICYILHKCWCLPDTYF